MEDFDGLVGIVSRKNILTDKLEEKFRAKYLDVKIFNSLTNFDFNKFNYLIINFLDNDFDETEVKNLVRNLECKILVIHPLYISESKKYVKDIFLNELLNENPNLGILLVPELLGYGVNYNPNFISHDLINQVITSERVKIRNSSQVINAVSITKLAERIVVETFSFGVSGQKVLLVGPRITPVSMALKMLGVPKDDLIIKNENLYLSEVDHTNVYSCDFSLSLAVKNSKKWFEENVVENPVKVVESPERKSFLKYRFLMKLTPIFIGLIVTPLLILFFGFLNLYLAFKFISTDSNKAVIASNLSEKSFSIVSRYNLGLDLISDSASFGGQLTEILKEMIYLGGIATNLATKILGDDVYNVSSYTDSLSASFDKIYLDLSFLEADMSKTDGYLRQLARDYLFKNNIDLEPIKSDIYNAKELSSRLAGILGTGSPKKYLVLFQNNMELRPTGGFIGSYAVLTIDKGRLTDISVNDVYSADGQLKGHVEPPEPIKKYLGEAGWYLRDSNWDPDFEESAKMAQWFLDKEVNLTVDGVIGVDLFFVKKLLEITGSVNLPDFNLTIDSGNLYSTTQNEVEENFFPGSIKKASFLTALTRFLMFEIEKIDPKRYFPLVLSLYSSLEGKHILIALNDKDASKFISNLGYSGNLDLAIGCGLRCLTSAYALVDANVGVNKANFFINRSQDLKIIVGDQGVSNLLVATYENKAKKGVGATGIYKTYTRVVLPKTAIVEGVRIYSADGSYQDVAFDSLQKADLLEIGFLMEVLPESLKKVQIEWKIPSDVLLSGGELRVKSIKQPGTEGDNLRISVESNNLSLTGGLPNIYNTALDKDIVQKFFFR